MSPLAWVGRTLFCKALMVVLVGCSAPLPLTSFCAIQCCRPLCAPRPLLCDQPLPAAGKERSTEYLMQCLQAVDVRMDTLAKVIGGYAEYIVRPMLASLHVLGCLVRW